MLLTRIKMFISNCKTSCYIFFKKPVIYILYRINKIHYKKVENKIKSSGRKTLNFAAYVMYDTDFGIDRMFREMIDDYRWNPMIVIIPDVLRGKENQLDVYKKTYLFFRNKYGQEYVVKGWNPKTNHFYDYLDNFDVVYYSNPYDAMAHKVHRIEYARKKDVLPFYITYGYEIGREPTLERLNSFALNSLWRVFTDTRYSYDDYKRYQIIKGDNVVLSGYTKMDNFDVIPKKNIRKKILITSHHTVSMKSLPLSNFLKYYGLFLKLPELFPDYDFVFRPHPLLFVTLRNNGIWSQNQIDNYISDLKSCGIEYSNGGEYFELFNECDAIINDCGSFTIEWLFTGKPGCFIKNSKLKKSQLTSLMYNALSQYCIVHNESEIIDFLHRIKDIDTLNCKMNSWVSKNIAINYPNASKYVIDEINILNH